MTILENLFGKNNSKIKQNKQDSLIITFDQTLDQLAEKYIGTKRVFGEGTIPLYSQEYNGRIFREILSIEIKGNNKYFIDFGDELIFDRDIELIGGNPSFKIIAPYQTGHIRIDTTLKAVELGNLFGCDYVFPDGNIKHLIGDGFELTTYLINKRK